MAETRYTLSLPGDLYEELKREAEKRESSIKEVVRQCLKFGLIGLQIDTDPSTDLVIRKRDSDASGRELVRDTLLRFI